ncbi:DeoR/GlpR family DNA-binding transcription regulator [Herbiconiux sp. YIM B11900]|uniref:DeoR/GlpR family DNA-binding transcription regulator n=1 Tax=Herbiconiux sp. YIM B11900 TaxID=3404131 RepID=UPI003F83985A
MAARRDAIVRALAEAGRVEVAELARMLGVADETVRRDLRELEAAGRLRRAHGGAIPSDVGAQHPEPAEGEDEWPAGTALGVARAVAGTIADGDAVYLDGGAVGEALVGLLPAAGGVRIMTASVPIALAAARAVDPPAVHLLGGQVGADGRAGGQWTRDLAGGLRLDVAVLGAEGLGAGDRLLAETADAAGLVAAVVEAARRVVLVGTPALLGAGGRGAVASAPLSAVDLAVLTEAPGPVLSALLAGSGVDVLVAGDASGPSPSTGSPSPAGADEHANEQKEGVAA